MATMNIKPLGNRLVVQLVKKQKTSASGIIIATEDKDEQTIGTVVAIGKGQGDDENISELDLKIGDTVMFGKYGGEEITDQHNPDIMYKIINGTDILAVIV
jgi:chaperonin GroES